MYFISFSAPSESRYIYFLGLKKICFISNFFTFQAAVYDTGTPKRGARVSEMGSPHNRDPVGMGIMKRGNITHITDLATPKAVNTTYANTTKLKIGSIQNGGAPLLPSRAVASRDVLESLFWSALALDVANNMLVLSRGWGRMTSCARREERKGGRRGEGEGEVKKAKTLTNKP